jgi:DNA-binding PadR family transcriptional regulator
LPDLDGVLRVRRHWFYILLSLAERDRHGSGIMRDVLELTENELKLWPVTLYGTLDELHEQGLIRALDQPPPDADDASARKRWFRITAAGRRALTAEVARMQETVQVASQRLARGGAS